MAAGEAADARIDPPLPLGLANASANRLDGQRPVPTESSVASNRRERSAAGRHRRRPPDGRPTNDTGHQPWPAHTDGSTRGRLAAGHGAGQNPTGSRPKPRPADRKAADALRAAGDRGVPLSPSQRMALGYAEGNRAHTDTQES